MRFITAILVLALFSGVLLTAQVPGEAEGKKLGTIISTALNVALPGVSNLIAQLFPNKKTSIGKEDFEKQMTTIHNQMKTKIFDRLQDISVIVNEINVLEKFLNPCIQIQDYVLEISVLIRNSPISDDTWKRVQSDWSLIEEKVKTIKSIDISPVREKGIKLILARMQGADSFLESVKRDFINRSSSEMAAQDHATLLRVKMSEMTTLYQVIQLVLSLSLSEFKSDFIGAMNSVSIRPSDKGDISKSASDKSDISKSANKRLDKILIREN